MLRYSFSINIIIHWIQREAKKFFFKYFTCLSLNLNDTANTLLSSGLKYLLALNRRSSAPVCAALNLTCPPFLLPPTPHQGLQHEGAGRKQMVKKIKSFKKGRRDAAESHLIKRDDCVLNHA